MANSVAIIIDNGSGLMKAGFTSDEAPGTVIPTIFEKEGTTSHEVSESKKLALSGIEYESPVKRSIITDWDGIEKLWQLVIEDKLKKSSEDHPLFLTEPSFNPKTNREKMAEIAFEKFKSPKLFLGIQSVLALYCYGRTYGTVLDVGYGTVRAVPVFEGFCQPQSAKKIDLAGLDLDTHLADLLQKQNFNLDVQNDKDTLNDVKEKHCYVARSVDDEKTKGAEIEKSYTMPDGKELKLGEERFMCPELLFNPSLCRKEVDGVHKIVHQAIESYGQKDMYNNIVLSGGSTMFEGMKERLEQEISDLTDNKETVSVKASERRGNLSFIGASILTALPTFHQLWLTKAEYEDQGVDAVHSKLK